ncbi:MAG: alpha-N-acetylglucosaminidase C-terminal domain-containing protein, partial [Bacteroidales bacterium]|nr:alpha-N-acetylglucosaminidase C-terminal domain-containing protein [Bacteroidales bacterium]
CMEGFRSWRVMHRTPYDNSTLVRLFKRLIDEPSSSDAWREDVATVGSQVLGNKFAKLRDSLAICINNGESENAKRLAGQMRQVLSDVSELTACFPAFRLDRWLSAAESFAASPDEEYYYRHNAWHLITTWGPGLNDYANRLWSGLVDNYYSKRWELFLTQALTGSALDQEAFDTACAELEESLVLAAPKVQDTTAGDVLEIGKRILKDL